ncbi:Signal transduction histidine kinase [Pseudobutyrivibrio sp. ACV-2]|uniref:sensor histidine kinase n=1 Tax=Pseudobutyrivibrio sp. ACV-2 TaxID=1520801 RepID=UPI0008987021|nr:sensor histidine kinase [Pseudobutyrivibrio sp. ACV-2]SEA73629.1 Signal transduction histidine kinase [Pseudobutyrivibrio sp. ACV-2]
MKKIKAFFSKSLYLELWLCIIEALVLGVLLYTLADKLNSRVVDSTWVKSNYVPTRTEQYINELQAYINENNLSSSDQLEIFYWYKRHPLFYFYIEKDGKIIYNYYADYTADDAATIKEYDKELEENSYLDYLYTFTYTISLADGECTLRGFEDFQYELYNILQNTSFFLCAALVIFIITIRVRKKIHYINDVTSGINILEAGDLNYNIPVKGNDEITHVAESLNSMRIALSQQMENEKKALQANNSLVTALSHDLRTPLTTQMGYLEILKEHRYKSSEEMDKYLNTALDTCHQIKEMSDRLFEYFLAFDPNPKRSEDALEELGGMDFFMQIISEFTPPLTDQGFKFDYNMPSSDFLINVNVDDILRIFNNVFTNIDKYADETYPVEIGFDANDDYALVSFTNKIRTTPRKNESAKIGLISISSLMKRQGGSSKTYITDDTFTVELIFPAKPTPSL